MLFSTPRFTMDLTRVIYTCWQHDKDDPRLHIQTEVGVLIIRGEDAKDFLVALQTYFKGGIN